MANIANVGKLRQVLDYWSCETCLEVYSPEQDYLCGVCARLNREVTVARTAVGRDEAVQVIPPEDFTMAKSLRDRIQQQEIELQEARSRLKKLGDRENDLQEQLRKLQDKLDKTKREKEESALVPFEFVGVKEPEEVVEFEEEAPEPEPTAATPPTAEPAAAAPQEQWEVIEEEPGSGTQPQEFAPGPAPEETPAAQAAEPSGQVRRVQATDDAIARIESEIAKIEQELTQLSEQEKELVKQGRTEGAKKTRRRSR